MSRQGFGDMQTETPEGGVVPGGLAPAAIGSAGIRMASEALNLLTSIVLARALGVGGYGIFAYAMALITLLVIPTTAGLPMVIVREVAIAHGRGGWSLIRGLGRWTSRAVLTVSLGIASLAALAAIVWPGHAASAVGQTFLIGLLLLPALSLVAVRAAALRGLHQVLLGQVPERLFIPALFLVLVGATVIWAGRDALDPRGVMAWQVIATGAALVFVSWMLVVKSPSGLRQARPIYQAKYWVAAAIPLMLMEGLQRANYEFGVVAVGLFESADAAGVFRVASRGADFVSFALTAMTMAIAPTLASLYAAGQRRRLEQVVRATARASLAWAVPGALVFAAMGGLILSTFFGEDFSSGAGALTVLSLGQLVNAATGPVALVLAMTGHERATVLGHSAGLVINIVLSLALIPAFGVAGAAVATAASVVARNLIMMEMVSRRLQLRVWGR